MDADAGAVGGVCREKTRAHPGAPPGRIRTNRSRGVDIIIEPFKRSGDLLLDDLRCIESVDTHPEFAEILGRKRPPRIGWTKSHATRAFEGSVPVCESDKRRRDAKKYAPLAKPCAVRFHAGDQGGGITFRRAPRVYPYSSSKRLLRPYVLFFAFPCLFE